MYDIIAMTKRSLVANEEHKRDALRGIYKDKVANLEKTVAEQAETIQHLQEVLRADGYRVSQTASGTIVLQ